MTAAQYWTPEWIETFVAALNGDEGFRKAAKSFEESMVLRCLDAPGGFDVQVVYRFSGGRCVGHVVEREPAPSRTLRDRKFDAALGFARTTAPYALWCKLDRGEMDVLQAIASPDYAVEGSKLKITWNVGVLNAMNAVAARVPKTF